MKKVLPGAPFLYDRSKNSLLFLVDCDIISSKINTKEKSMRNMECIK